MTKLESVQWVIYALCDPRVGTSLGDTRYLGITTKPIPKRLHWHIRAAKYDKHRNHRKNWLRNLLKAEVEPVVVHLENGINLKTGHNRERWWISFLRRIGCSLTNATSGGNGTVGYKHTPEECARRSARRKGMKLPATWVANIRKAALALRGKPRPESWKRNISRGMMGRKVNAKTRAKMSATRMGIRLSAETCARISASKKGVPWSEKARAAIRRRPRYAKVAARKEIVNA